MILSCSTYKCLQDEGQIARVFYSGCIFNNLLYFIILSGLFLLGLQGQKNAKVLENVFTCQAVCLSNLSESYTSVSCFLKVHIVVQNKVFLIIVQPSWKCMLGNASLSERGSTHLIFLGQEKNN